MLIEFHMLQNHAPANLNRDDTGSPKEAVFGGHLRARISSQCLKRSIRRSPLFREALQGRLADRSRKIAERLTPELERLGLSSDEVAAITQRATTLGSGKVSAEGETRQTMFLTDAEVRRLAVSLTTLYRKDPQGFAALDLEKEADLASSTVPEAADIAMFGRMTTSAAFQDVTAAMQVAHALSTGKLERQTDYYTAVDDLAGPMDDAGADMIGEVEFNSACFYKYFSLDWDGLVKNLSGDEQLARQALVAFLEAAALTTPTGKQNSFAAHNPPDAILVEVKEKRIPVSYANAFVQPARAAEDRDGRTLDLVEASIARLACYAARLGKAYPLHAQRFWLTTRDLPFEGATPVSDLEALGRMVLRAIPEAR